MTMDVRTTRTLVLGSGLAGLYAALRAAEAGDVTIVTRASLRDSASYWAQGGVAAALALDDSPDAHLADTERAGRDLVRRSAAEVLVAEAPTHVARLQAFGVRFDADRNGRMALGLEGGHTQRRVVHAGGSWGVQLSVNPNRIEVLQNGMVKKIIV